ncbi:transposase DNA-binding-containing protein [Cupriavidus necator]|uniref:IS4/Tn5 family transposase DNA-binding protein n=1 Tax=Cupriavidus necator TaxID=106590 RepID=UPI0039C26219
MRKVRCCSAHSWHLWSLGLGVPRRDRRAKELLKRFAALPTASIPGACDDWSQTIAAYRFLGNEQIDWRDVRQPHWARTAARAGQFPVMLCIADTSVPAQRASRAQSTSCCAGSRCCPGPLQ